MAFACSNDFPNAPDNVVTLEALDWPSELHVTDVDTIEVRVRLRDAPQTITGLRIRWASSNDAVLQVVQLQPTNPDDPEETLVAQLRAQVTARSGGPDTVRVVVDSGAGFERAESTFVIRVTQKWIAVSAGTAHTCGITVDSLAYCWGEGNDGRLGRGRPVGSAAPVRVIGPSDLRFSSISAGEKSTCGISVIGLAYCWGFGEEGRLGDADPSERSQLVPVPVSGPSFQSLDVGRIACAVPDDFVAVCWGGNTDNQLGFSINTSPGLNTCKGAIPCSLAPRLIYRDLTTFTTPTTYTSVTVGGHHACGISESPQSGRAFCWGRGPAGALGNATITDSATPVPVSSGLTFISLSAGGDHTCGVTTATGAYCWGENADGQLGNSTTADALVPTSVPGISFAAISAGSRHTCGLTTSGEALCWGLGSSGQLGNGSAERRLVPTPVAGGLRFESLSTGDLHTCGVAVGGALYCWGEGVAGQLGSGTPERQLSPTRVVEPERGPP